MIIADPDLGGFTPTFSKKTSKTTPNTLENVFPNVVLHFPGRVVREETFGELQKLYTSGFYKDFSKGT